MNKLNQSEYFSVSFVGLNLCGQEVNTKEFDSCLFKECDFSETRFKQCKFIDCVFIDCNLSLLKVYYSRFLDVTFEKCKMIGVDWTRADWPSFALPSPLKFYSCVLNDSHFFALNLKELLLSQCKVHDVDFRGGDFSQADFSGSDFCNSLFNETNLCQADFTDAFNYNINIFNNKIKNAKFSSYEALNLLNSLDIELVD